MNWLKYLVGLSALVIAGCAAYFSVTGLGVLFAGASISVMIMASSLELAKLVAATYLKQKWDEIQGFNKWYLTSAVALLMLITSAGIFGYLSNAFQQQSLQIQQVDREILVHQTKITTNEQQITQFTTQISNLQQNSGKILDGGKVNNRLIRSIDNRDKQINKINDKISKLQEENAQETEKINQIKVSNLNLEKEVGGFRFVAEAFGVELKNVVKFFIFLIVIVFDPLAVALIIAFNGLVSDKKKKRHEILTEMMENDQKLGLYEVYGDKNDNIVENNLQNDEFSGKNLTKEEEIPVIVENNPIIEEILPNLQENINLDVNNDGIITEDEISADIDGDGMISEEEKREWYNDTGWKSPYEGRPYYMHPWFDWNRKDRWINDQNAVNYWLNFRGGNVRALEQYKSEFPDDFTTKTY